MKDLSEMVMITIRDGEPLTCVTLEIGKLITVQEEDQWKSKKGFLKNLCLMVTEDDDCLANICPHDLLISTMAVTGVPLITSLKDTWSTGGFPL